MGPAILCGGIIYWMPAPARHADVGQAMVKNGFSPPYPGGEAQGFMMKNGQFARRKSAALTHQKAGGALSHPPNLFSEDLW